MRCVVLCIFAARSHENFTKLYTVFTEFRCFGCFFIVQLGGIKIQIQQSGENKKMKKLFRLAIFVLCIAVAFGAVGLFTACAGDSIAVISRDAVSGSRLSFDYSVRNAENQSLATWQATAGNRIPGDQSPSEAAVISTVAGNRNAIGYASLSAVQGNDRVRMLSVNGARPGEAGYPALFMRDFVILAPELETQALLPRTQVFWDFLQSTQAKTATEYFGLTFGTDGNAFTAPADPGQAYPIQVRGSTTVSDLMEHLIGTFVALVPWATAAMFDFNAAGSGNGRDVGANRPLTNFPYTPGAAIGMSSAGVDIGATGRTFRLAYDTTVVIVHPSNAVENITVAQIFGIYTGAITSWGYFTEQEAA